MKRERPLQGGNKTGESKEIKEGSNGGALLGKGCIRGDLGKRKIVTKKTL